MTIKENDFVRVDYIGKDADGAVFDTTLADVAKDANVHDSRMGYEPIVVCVGQGHLLAALETALVGKKEGDTFSVTLQPEDAFGKKRSDMIKLMPITLFRKEKINPFPGLDVTVDNMRGKIKSVSGNRVIVDFNHVLAGKTLTYELRVKEKIADVKQQVEALSGMLLRFTPQVAVEGTKATLSLPIELPDTIAEPLTEKITSLTSVTAVEYVKLEQKTGKTA